MSSGWEETKQHLPLFQGGKNAKSGAKETGLVAWPHFQNTLSRVQLSSKSTCLIMYKPWGSVSKTEKKIPSTDCTEDRVERKGPGRE